MDIREENKLLKQICPNEIASTEIDYLTETVRKSELFVSTQMENFRAIDTRATRLMTGVGVMLTIIFGLVTVSSNGSLSENSIVFFSLFGIVAFASIICLALCLQIIQSDSVCPPGNDGFTLLKDMSEKYSFHEERVDYIFGLSISRCRNEKLIVRNGSYLRKASWAFFIMVIALLLLAITIIY